MAVKTCLMIGVSGMAGGWIGRMTERLGDRIQIVGLVDVNEEVLAVQGAKLGLVADQLFADYKEACAKVQADFCGIATPPQFHSRRRLPRWKQGCRLFARSRLLIP